MRKLRACLLFMVFILPVGRVVAQHAISERVYLSFDKPVYAVGDTAWFAVYVTTGLDNRLSALSSRVYVELITEQGELAKRIVVPIGHGLGSGDFTLAGDAFEGGRYTIRAYTNWMRNFGDAHFYSRDLVVNKFAGHPWYITASLHEGRGESTTTLDLTLTGVDGGRPVTGEMELTVANEKGKTWTTKVRPESSGRISTGFPSSARDGGLVQVSLRSGDNKTPMALFPLFTSSAEADIQFLPEGGRLVADLYNHVGVKAIGPDGKGIDVSGTIVDESGAEMAVFRSEHKGMGSFNLMPRSGARYTARVQAQGTAVISRSLPPVLPSGFALRVNAWSNPDSIYVFVGASPDQRSRPSCRLELLGRDSLAQNTRFSLVNGFYNARFAKTAFIQGPVRVTVYDSSGQPVAGRTIFNERGKQLSIDIEATPAVSQDTLRLSMQLKLADSVSTGVFSVSVTDDARVTRDNLGENIVSRFLLGAYVKGSIEGAGWYFSDLADAGRRRAIDNLLLTQGWVQFELPKTPDPPFIAETSSMVSGRVTNLFKKPVAGAMVRLLSMKNDIFVLDTVTDEQGRFRFDRLPLRDTSYFSLKLRNKKGRESAANLELDDFLPAALPAVAKTGYLPWYVNPDTALISTLSLARKSPAPNGLPVSSGKMLDAVELKGKRNTRSFGDTWVVELLKIDEKELIEAKKTSLYDLMRARFPGLTHSSFYYNLYKNRPWRFKNERFVIGNYVLADVEIDGISVNKIYAETNDTSEVNNSGALYDGNNYYEFLNRFFHYVNASDVKDIRLFRDDKMRFVSIVTRSGSGPHVNRTIGSFAYRPVNVYLPRKFYQPKYLATDPGPSQHSTVFWEPLTVTSEEGLAVLKMTPPPPGKYTITVEGTDGSGNFVHAIKRITIDERKR